MQLHVYNFALVNQCYAPWWALLYRDHEGLGILARNYHPKTLYTDQYNGIYIL